MAAAAMPATEAATSPARPDAGHVGGERTVARSATWERSSVSRAVSKRSS